MDDKDITVEEQKRLDRELTEKALKGADIVRILIIMQFIGIVYRFFTVDSLLVFRFIESAINVFFVLEFRMGAQWARVLLLVSSALSLIRSVSMLFVVVILASGVTASSAILAVLLCLLDVVIAGLWVYFLIIDKRVDSYFKFLNSPRYNELIREYEKENNE